MIYSFVSVFKKENSCAFRPLKKPLFMYSYLHEVTRSEA